MSSAIVAKALQEAVIKRDWIFKWTNVVHKLAE